MTVADGLQFYLKVVQQQQLDLSQGLNFEPENSKLFNNVAPIARSNLILSYLLQNLHRLKLGAMGGGPPQHTE